MRVLRTYCHVGPAGLYRALDSGRDFLRVAGRKYHSSELSVSAINIPGKILNGARVPFRGYYGARASKYLHAEPQESIETYSRSPLQQTEVTFSGSGGRSTGSAGWFRYREVESKRGTGLELMYKVFLRRPFHGRFHTASSRETLSTSRIEPLLHSSCSSSTATSFNNHRTRRVSCKPHSR